MNSRFAHAGSEKPDTGEGHSTVLRAAFQIAIDDRLMNIERRSLEDRASCRTSWGLRKLKIYKGELSAA